MVDIKTKHAVKYLLKTKEFSNSWIIQKFNISKEELHNIIKKSKKKITKIKYADKIELVKRICKDYPELSIKDKAKKAGISFGSFSSIKHKLNIKQDQYVPSKKLRDRRKEIREKYSTGLYTYQALGNEYGITRERIRQICNDIYIELKKENKLKYIRKPKINKEYIANKKRILYIFAVAYLRYNKSVLTTSEVVVAYYNVFIKNGFAKALKYATVLYKLHDLCNGDFIQKICKGNYSLTELGLNKIQDIVKEIEG